MLKKILFMLPALLFCIGVSAQNDVVVIGKNKKPFVWKGDAVKVIDNTQPAKFTLTKDEGGSIVAGQGKHKAEVNDAVTALDKVKAENIEAWFDSGNGEVCFVLGANLEGNYTARLYDVMGRFVTQGQVSNGLTTLTSPGSGLYILTVMGEDGSFVCSCKIVAK